MNKNPGRQFCRLAAREANRKDGKQRNALSEQRGNTMAVYRAGRVKQAGR
jgi:hypothetical protein